MPKKLPADPLRARLLELTQEIDERLSQLRDFGSTPGNIWLARGELQAITALLSDLEAILEDIKSADYESGY